MLPLLAAAEEPAEPGERIFELVCPPPAIESNFLIFRRVLSTCTAQGVEVIKYEKVPQRISGI